MAEACPAYPWQQQDGAQRGQKMFMLGDCASCHHAMLREPAVAVAVARGEMGVLQAAEIVFAFAEETQPVAAAAKHLHGGAYTPDLTTLAAKIQGGPLYNNLYFTGGATMPRMLAEGVLVCQELKKKIALQFAHPYMGTFVAA